VLVIHENRGLIRISRMSRGAPRWKAPGPRARRPVFRWAVIQATTIRAARCRRTDQAKLRGRQLNSARYVRRHGRLNGKLGVTGFLLGAAARRINLAVAMGSEHAGGRAVLRRGAETAGVPNIKPPFSSTTPRSERVVIT